MKLGAVRGGQSLTLAVPLAALPTDVPASLPAAHSESPPAAGAPGDVGLVEITIPEEPNKCLALIPANYTPQVACGVLVHLPVPGAFDRDAFAAQWRTLGQQQDLIVLAPQPQMPAGWSPTEVDFLRKAIENVAGRYTVDRTRIVVYGYQGSGTMVL